MAVKSLLLRSAEVIIGNVFMLGRKACRVLPPPLLRYLLYLALKNVDVAWIECLVRHWPLETLSFDMYDFLNDDDNIDDGPHWKHLLGVGDDIEVYLRRYHSWFCTSLYKQMRFNEAMVSAIARGLYSRVYESQSIDQATSGAKQFIVDMSMVYLLDFEIKRKSHVVLQARFSPTLVAPL